MSSLMDKNASLLKEQTRVKKIQDIGKIVTYVPYEYKRFCEESYMRPTAACNDQSERFQNM